MPFPMILTEDPSSETRRIWIGSGKRELFRMEFCFKAGLFSDFVTVGPSRHGAHIFTSGYMFFVILFCTLLVNREASGLGNVLFWYQGAPSNIYPA
jgi:hypothetical protein